MFVKYSVNKSTKDYFYIEIKIIFHFNRTVSSFW